MGYLQCVDYGKHFGRAYRKEMSEQRTNVSASATPPFGRLCRINLL
jgi:hypothetical protein